MPLTMHETEVVKVDQFAEAHGIEQIELLKVDVEGAELDVLRGAGELIRERRIRAIQFEISYANAVRKSWMRDHCELLTGYSLYRLLPRGLLPLGEYRSSSHEVFRFHNLVAFRDAPPA